ncbi:copper chaperone PCu(A)C [Deinococcus sp.]|uniref:copper chaperone PCu(A)C n=1 Tax=Deinococcus sp. TaxID=47478 RepID=UPI0025BD94C4|nr:copper chaperone PCu(A)C [Deinococcus sp.]
MTSTPNPRRKRSALIAVLGALIVLGTYLYLSPALHLSAAPDARTATAQTTPAGQPMSSDMDHTTMPGHTPGTAQGSAASGALPLTVRDAYVVAVPPGIRETSVFGVLNNTGTEDVILNGAGSSAAQSGMLMVTHTDAQGLTGMSMTGTLTVPAGGSLILSSTGDHVMLTGLSAPIRDGTTLPVTLTDTQGRHLTLSVPVRRP